MCAVWNGTLSEFGGIDTELRALLTRTGDTGGRSGTLRDARERVPRQVAAIHRVLERFRAALGRVGVPAMSHGAETARVYRGHLAGLQTSTALPRASAVVRARTRTELHSELQTVVSAYETAFGVMVANEFVGLQDVAELAPTIKDSDVCRYLPGWVHGESPPIAARFGDCLAVPPRVTTNPYGAYPVACASAHWGEVYAVVRDSAPSDAVYPGDRAQFRTSVSKCRRELERFVRSPQRRQALNSFAAYPGRPGWDSGARDVVCILSESDRNTLHRSLRAAAA
ncbi:MAG TPA: septum formation family protein [Acidimicrobiia bacterium]|nr:septum formation family protein [Acidimicrobiia bacterium]